MSITKLVAVSREPVQDVVTAADAPISIRDLEPQILDLYETGLQPGLATGWPSLTPYYTVKPGQVTVVTGIPHSGKSPFVNQLALHCVVSHDWKVAWCSLEHLPYADLSARLLEQFYKGMSFTHGAVMKMSRKDITQALDVLKDRVFFLPPSEEDPTIPGVLHRCHALVQAGLNGLIIDPYGEFEHKRPNGMTETEYVSQLLTQIRLFARQHLIHVWIVAHPTKIQKLDNGTYPVVKPYDISGSSAWFNKPDCILSIYRDYVEPTHTQVHVQKCKFREVGKVGSVTLRHDVITSLFQEMPQTQDEQA